MLYKKIEQLTVADFQDLIDNGVNESKSIEYKEELTIGKDDERKEFLYDVSAFANAGGGDLIFGISEKKDVGLPNNLIGIDIQNKDELKLKLENLIRDGISPRITGLQIETFSLPNSKDILLLRIPKSWNSPHQVTFKGTDKFYTRGTNGKYKLDVGELRNAFLYSNSVTEKIRKLREDRLLKIIAHETPIIMRENAKIVLHIMPVNSFASDAIYNLDFIVKADQSLLKTIGNSPYLKHNYNLDGVVGYPPYKEIDVPGYNGYVQIFRNGVIESVNSEILVPYNNWRKIPSSRGWNYEELILERYKEYFDILKTLQIEPPFSVSLAFISVKDYFMEYDNRNIRSRQEPPLVDRDILILPEIIIEDYTTTAEKQLKPLFDMVWNACGLERSMSYDKDGNWINK